MKFNVLHNFISPVTGRILCDPNYVLVGDANGIAIPTISIPIITLPNLSTNKFWVGSAMDRPVEAIVDIPVCYAATTLALAANYNNGILGVGATLTSTAPGILTIDLVPPFLNSLILVKNQPAGYQNGVYVVTVLGSTETPWVLTRANIYNKTHEIREGDSISVQFGAVNGLSTWVQTNIINNIGTDSINYIGPMGPAGPAGPAGAAGVEGLAGIALGGLAKGVGNGLVSAIFDATFGTLRDLLGGGASLLGKILITAAFAPEGGVAGVAGAPGASATSGQSTFFINANLNLNGGRIANIEQSPQADFDAISARFVWDLFNDNVEIKWQ